ncbi:ABC transporter ATP-binding protein [Clostridium sp. FP1]|uniref:ABC transporter ATP-binding protein n=1 Tax=Clostridium sp. FP1 TaxID=2724076 RepID=UPI0013E98BD9|nr:ABC transporter ATP-binding protein [Clostridium sp. FP1]MBZ9636645.1 ABC transporter ATP-binding protein [Clostridium sp. FP1]
MPDIAIKVENLSKIYKLYAKPLDRLKESLSPSKKKYSREHYALNNISFEVKKGETIGILGTNGSGKSTLLKIITGVLTPSMGNIKVNGKISALLELGAGFNPEYSGLENIYLNGTMMGYTKEQMDQRVNLIMEFANIGEFIDQPVKTYSSGMFARLAFAVAINVEPDILIVDEALAVGDIRFQIKCMDKMKKMMEGGTTVLFVSHDINAIRRFCMKAIWLNDGFMKEIGEVNRIADKYLDFLKCAQVQEENYDLEKNNQLKPFVPGENIAEVIDFKILDKSNNIVNEVKLDEYLKIDVTYDVYDENIKSPVLGIAIKSITDDYVCGLNTLLDKISIPWKYGRNKFQLEYTYGIRAIGGKYYFHVALFEETATVPIQYISNIKDITVISDYIGEGRYIMPHVWREDF